MTYEDAQKYIASLEPRGWRLGLDRMQEFIRRADLLDAVGKAGGPQFIQVAGTNGKGSTTAFLQSLMVESGYRTGAYFSPYVVDPRERVQYGRDLITKEELAQVTETLIPAVESFSENDFGGVTEFELKTAIGFQYWKQKRCEWVALEVGLGGRLDATTVATPRATIIVSIGLDHMHILGETHAKIAAEKAGIIKPGVPVIVGEMPTEAEEVILDIASQSQAEAWRWGREVTWCPECCAVRTPNGLYKGLKPGIPGAAQEHNLSLAVAAMDAAGAITNERALQKGAMLASIPGRFQVLTYRGQTVVLDGAHNPDAARVLAKSLDDQFPTAKVHLVTNMLAGHEPASFYEILKDRVKSTSVVPVDFHRSTPVDKMVAHLANLLPQVQPFQTPLEGLNNAAEEAQADEIVLVTGSFYLVGELLRVLEPS
jgi:dihydrofolate synthase/folylpolyglutamate synthase